ncbi:MAG: NAD(P)-dependent oxidoreductase [Patescibacteria group bacterium]
MKIHYFAGEGWEEQVVREKLVGDEIIFHEGPFSAHADVSDSSADALCVFMESRIGEAEMNRFPALKLIATRSTGFDHIDLATAAAKGITVVNVPFYGENTVAEFAFALLLSLSRRIPEAQARVRSGAFSPAGLRGFDLADKTIGVVGCGHIGMHMIKMANGFGMKVLGFDVRQDPQCAIDNNFTYATLDEILASADIISLHAPYNPHTHHLLNAENMKNIKKGAYLINTARGALVDTAALVAALEQGVLAGAALDVLEEEGDLAHEESLLNQPHPKEEELRTTLANHYLIDHPRVIVTPHLAFNTQEAVGRILTTTIENIQHFATGAPTNVVKSS